MGKSPIHSRFQGSLHCHSFSQFSYSPFNSGLFLSPVCKRLLCRKTAVPLVFKPPSAALVTLRRMKPQQSRLLLILTLTPNLSGKSNAPLPSPHRDGSAAEKQGSPQLEDDKNRAEPVRQTDRTSPCLPMPTSPSWRPCESPLFCKNPALSLSIRDVPSEIL